MSKPGTKAKDAGAEYAEIWGETLHANRHLRVISVGLGIGLLLRHCRRHSHRVGRAAPPHRREGG